MTKRTKPAPAHIATRNSVIEGKCLHELLENNGYIVKPAPARDRYFTAFSTKTSATHAVVGMMLWVPVDSVLGRGMMARYKAMEAKAARAKRKSASQRAKKRIP